MKYLDLYAVLKKAIGAGKYPSGTHIPHTYDLMERHQVSLTTVVKAVKMLEREGLVRRIKSKGTFVLGQGLEQLAAAQKAPKVGLLFDGLLSANLQAHFFVNAFRGIEEACAKGGRRLLPLGLHQRNVPEVLEEVRRGGINGVIAYGFHDEELLRGLKRLKIPLVLCDYIDYALNEDQVTTDHLRGGSLAFHHLAGLGHKKILFLGHFKANAGLNDRDHEYWRLGCEAEARFNPLVSFDAVFIAFKGGHEEMKRKIRAILEKQTGVTGFICASTTYYLLLKELLEAGPTGGPVHDIVLFSDWSEKKRIHGRPVFQCRWETREMGRLSAEILISKIKGGAYRPAIHYVPIHIE